MYNSKGVIGDVTVFFSLLVMCVIGYAFVPSKDTPVVTSLDKVELSDDRVSVVNCTRLGTCLVHGLCYTGNELAVFSGESDVTYNGLSAFVRTRKGKYNGYTLTDRAVVIKSPFERDNYGHVLGDDVFASFCAMEEFGVTEEIIPIIASDSYHGSDKVWGFLTKEKPRLLSSFAESCFATAIVHVEPYGYSTGHNPEPSNYYRTKYAQIKSIIAFRRYAMMINGIKEYTGDNMNILFVKKDVSRSVHPVVIDNLDAVIKETEDVLRSYKVEYDLNVVSWPGLSAKEQLELVSRQHFYFYSSGSDGMNAMFLPPGSVVIIQCNVIDSVVKSNADEYRVWFEFAQHLKVYQICELDRLDRHPGLREVHVNIDKYHGVIDSYIGPRVAKSM